MLHKKYCHIFEINKSQDTVVSRSCKVLISFFFIWSKTSKFSKKIITTYSPECVLANWQFRVLLNFNAFVFENHRNDWKQLSGIPCKLNDISWNLVTAIFENVFSTFILVCCLGYRSVASRFPWYTESADFHANFAFIFEGVAYNFRRKLSQFFRENQMKQKFCRDFVGKIPWYFHWDSPLFMFGKEKWKFLNAICSFLSFFSLPILTKLAKPNYN